VIPMRTVLRSPAIVAVCLIACSCGYRLAPMDRTAHLALSAEGAVHPDAVPAMHEALAASLRDDGIRLLAGAAEREIDVVVLGTVEIPSMPTRSVEGRFEPTAWDVRLRARATLRRADGPESELGEFEASGLEAAGESASADDRAQTSSFALAAALLAERITAAVLAAW
jgi:hypothetical protein